MLNLHQSVLSSLWVPGSRWELCVFQWRCLLRTAPAEVIQWVTVGQDPCTWEKPGYVVHTDGKGVTLLILVHVPGGEGPEEDLSRSHIKGLGI